MSEKHNKKHEKKATSKDKNKSEKYKELESKIKETLKEAEEHKELALRIKAEFDNFRKRTAREYEETVNTANENLIKQLLSVIDAFERALNPENIKDDEVYVATRPTDMAFPVVCIHDYYTNHPGRVALNVLEASSKTYVHEFAHAMSSNIHGAIVDEYFGITHMK